MKEVPIRLFSNQIVRWICVLPGAIIGSAAAQAIAKILNYLQMGDSTLSRFFIEAMSGFVMGATFIYIGSSIAPTHKKQTAIVMLTIISALFGISIFLAISQGGHFWTYVNAIPMIFSAGAVTFNIFQTESKI